MKYFITEITTTEAGTAKAVTEKDTFDEARMVFHQVMASAFANPAVTYALCEIVGEDGNRKKVDMKVPEKEPEPNEQ